MRIVALLFLFYISSGCLQEDTPRKLGNSPTDIPNKQGDLRVVTYNLYCWNACPRDYVFVKLWLQSILPTTDVIAFQEFECHECSWWKQARRWLESTAFGGNRFKSVLSTTESVDIWVKSNAQVVTNSFNEIGRDHWGGRNVLTTEVQINGLNLKFANHHGCLGAKNSGCHSGGQPAVFSELESQGFFADDGALSMFLCDCNDMQHHMNAFCDRGFMYQKTKGGPLSGYDNIAWGSGFTYMQAVQFDGRGSGGASDHQGLLIDFAVGEVPQCDDSCKTCDLDKLDTCTSCPEGKVLNDGKCVEGRCQESNWPDLDHGKVCGDCKVLVDNFQTSYGTCSGYCRSIGRTCTGAWDEVEDSCSELMEMTCDQKLDSSDAICECGEADEGSDGSDSGETSTCDEQSWPDLDHGLVCGECKVLVNNFRDYGSCSKYCQSINMGCKNAWEEKNDTCDVLHAMSCDDSIDSSDAICECDPSAVPCGNVPNSCQGHIDWAMSTGRVHHSEYYPEFETVTGKALMSSSVEDMQLYFYCKDTGHEECKGLQLPCGRSCGN